jgi:glycosyltransferase involved in cell wall biosynthesis
MAAPTLSVVIPAYNASRTLGLCLQSIAASQTASLECIVVDDGSTDSTVEVARGFGAKVLCTGGRRGPAHARNLGARAAAGEIVFFIDADICVHPNTLSRLLEGFVSQPERDAMIGSYDDSPEQQDVLSMYRNLMHRYVHQHGREEASTFWSGCGAIRRSVFLKHGGFDERYRRPAIEDIELGYRLAAAGHKIFLDRGLEVKHLKRWTFLNLIKTDIFDRGMPWTELILRDGRMPNDLNIQLSQRVSVALAFLLFGFALAGALYYKGLFLAPFLAIMLFGLACYWAETTVMRAGVGIKVCFAALASAFTWMAYTHHMRTLIPPVLVGYFLLLIRYRYGYGTQTARKATGVAYAAYLVASLIFITTYLPARVPVICFFVMLLLIVAINRNFYFFLGSRMGWLTAFTAIPFHVLFYFYNGIAFLTGLVSYAFRMTRPGRYRVVAVDQPVKFATPTRRNGPTA